MTIEVGSAGDGRVRVCLNLHIEAILFQCRVSRTYCVNKVAAHWATAASLSWLARVALKKDTIMFVAILGIRNRPRAA